MEAIGDGIYVRSILRGTTRPHFFSWIVWALMLGVVLYGQVVGGAGPGAWLTGYRFLGVLAIVGLSTVHGDKSLTRLDMLAFAAAFAGMGVLTICKTPLLSTCIETGVSAVLWYPSFRKTWNKPQSEPPLAYCLYAVPTILQLLAIETYSATTLIFPVGALTLTLVFVATVLWRRKAITQANERHCEREAKQSKLD